MHIFIGTYTRSTSRGIHRLTFDPATGALGAPELAAEISSPTWLTWGPGRRTLLAVDAGGEGGVACFGVKPGTGHLSPEGSQATGGGSPCHIAVDRTGRLAVSASYGQGVVAAFPLHANGNLGPRTSHIRHTGRGPHPERQTSAHAHGVTFAPDEKFLFVPDLGGDRVKAYRVEAVTGHLEPHPAGDHVVAPGAGPRHLSFAPDGAHGYLINELDSTVNVLRYEAGEGRFHLEQTLNTLPAEFAGTNTTAEIAVHPAGHSVYGSNRGHDSIVVYKRDPKTGKLTFLQHAPCGGKTPRHFKIDPSGTWLLCGHQNSDTISVLSLDPATGLLGEPKSTVPAPKPICILFP
jgi:6-phosphogluconolactonase